MITVWVPGCAKTKGSMTPQRGGRRLVQSVQGSDDWATLVTAAVANAHPRFAMAGPVGVSLRFWLPVRDAVATRSGDVDKLARNVLDALTKAGAYGDDVQVTKLQVEKYPARPHPGPGLLLKVWPLAPHPLDEIGWAELRRIMPGLPA
jgi:Holliday junction resolvase RusA-like endonuclease